MAETLNGSWIQRYRTNNNRTVMENAELLKRIIKKLPITEAQFEEAFAKVMIELVDDELDNMAVNYNHNPEQPAEMNEAFRFWKQNIA